MAEAKALHMLCHSFFVTHHFAWATTLGQSCCCQVWNTEVCDLLTHVGLESYTLDHFQLQSWSKVF